MHPMLLCINNLCIRLTLRRMLEQFWLVKNPYMFFQNVFLLPVSLVQHYSCLLYTSLEPILARLELPEFNFDSWWLWGGNVVLHISPEDEFTKIYDAVISALESVVGPERTVKTPHGKFIAHTSLAYTRSHDKEHELHNQLVAHPVTPVSFKVGYLPLLRQWAHDGHYEWEVIKKIPIGKGS